MSLFGQSPGQVRQAIEDRARLSDQASLPNSFHKPAFMAAGQAGRHLGNVLLGHLGRQDPQVQRAEQLQSIEQQIMGQVAEEGLSGPDAQIRAFQLAAQSPDQELAAAASAKYQDS